MEKKYLEEYKVIFTLQNDGIIGDDEYLRVLQETFQLNYEGAVQILISYYDDFKEIKKLFSKDKQNNVPKQFGE